MITDPILFRYLAGEASRKENEQVTTWLNDSTDNQIYLNELKEFFLAPAEISRPSDDTNADWDKLLGKIILESGNRSRTLSGKWIRLLIRVAALILLLATSGVILRSLDGEYTIKAKSDQSRRVYLPDGSQVDLTAGSVISFSKKYMKGERLVNLTGEACFDVRSNPEHPFTVNTREAKVKVTGTEFTVSAPRHSGQVEVTVRSGKVLFYNSEILTKNAFQVGLGAGEKGIYTTASNKLDKINEYQITSVP